MTKSQVRDDYMEEAGGEYINGLSFNTWDHRFNTISDDIASTPWLVEISIDRHIWKAIGVFNVKDGTLYLVTSYTNFRDCKIVCVRMNNSLNLFL
ncbi:DUF5986 family protein [Lactobacillus crispatus]|uniref:DUF5986 family protein n=1 Tax=Lactobacillus crispatus TaxID=47770 RepID=UPI002FCD768F